MSVNAHLKSPGAGSSRNTYSRSLGSSSKEKPGNSLLLDLPIEIQRTIVKHVSRKQLTNLQLVSKHFLDLASARIYGELIFLLSHPESPLHLTKREFRLGHALETLASGSYDYCQHVKTFSLHLTERLPADLNCKIIAKLHWEEEATRFLNTLLQVVLRKTSKLEGFWWMVPVELFEATYTTLADIKALHHVSIKLDTAVVSKYFRKAQNPVPPIHANAQLGMTVQQSASQLTNPFVLSASSHDPAAQPSHKLRRSGTFSSRDERRKFSSFRNLQQFEVMGIDQYDCVPEIASCLQSCSTTLKSLCLSMSRDMVVSVPKPRVVEHYHDVLLESDEEAPTEPDSPPGQTPEPAEVNVGSKNDARKQKSAQVSMLAKIFGLESTPVEDRAVDRALKSYVAVGAGKANHGNFIYEMVEIVQKTLASKATGSGGTATADTAELVNSKAFNALVQECVEKYNLEGLLKQKSPKGGRKADKKVPKYGAQAHAPKKSKQPSHSHGHVPAGGTYAANAFGGGPSDPGTSPLPKPPGSLMINFDDLLGTAAAQPPPGVEPSAHYFQKLQDQIAAQKLAAGDSYDSYHSTTLAKPYAWGSGDPGMKSDGKLAQALYYPHAASSQSPLPSSSSVGYGHQPALGLASQYPTGMMMPHDGQSSKSYKSSWNVSKQAEYSNKYKKKNKIQQASQSDYSQDSTASSDTEADEPPPLAKLPYFPAVDQKASDGEIEVDMDHPDLSGDDADFLEDSSESESVKPASGSRAERSFDERKTRNPAVSPANPQPHALASSKCAKQTDTEQTMKNYLRMQHGFSLERLAIYLIPVKPSVLGRAIDLSVLRSLALLSVGPQGAFWLLMSQQMKAGKDFKLTSLQTDDVSLAFLNFVASISGVENLFMLMRNKKDFDCTTSKVPASLDDIRIRALRVHAPSLKRLMIVDHERGIWDLDTKCIRLLAAKAQNLREFAFNIGPRAWHVFLQALSGFRSLVALNLVTFRTVGPLPQQVTEVRDSLLDALYYCPEVKLKYAAMAGLVYHVLRHGAAQSVPKVQTTLDPERDRFGKGKSGKGKAPANPWDLDATDEEKDKMNDDKREANGRGEGKGDSKAKVGGGSNLNGRLKEANFEMQQNSYPAVNTEQDSDIEKEEISISFSRPMVFTDPECHPRVAIFHKRVRVGRW